MGMEIAPFVRGIDLTGPYQFLREMEARLIARLDQLEANLMTTQAEAFDALSAKVDDILSDFQALLVQLAAERENLTEAGQAALDALTAKVAALDVAVGDADGSDTPAPEPEPVPEPEPEPAPEA